MILQWKTFSHQVNLIHNEVRINTSFFQSTILKILSWCTSSLQRWLMDYYDLRDFYRFMSTVFFFFLMLKLFHLWPMEAPYSWLLGPFDITLLLLLPCFQTQDCPTSFWIFPAPFNGTVWVLGYALLLDSDRYQAFSMGKAMQYAFLRKIKIDNYILLVFSVKNAITGFLLDFILVSLPLLYKNLGS